MTTTSWILTGLFAAGGAVMLNSGSADDLEAMGDIFQYLLPASAWGSTWIAHDGAGAVQFTLQFGAGTLATYGLKSAFEKRTPSAADFDSFPSAHTQAAFSGASFIHRRYGPRWGVPAYALAAFTGLSRVKADRHYLDDVISGMSIALLSDWIFTSPIEDRVALNPLLVDRGFGVSVGIKGGSQTPGPRESVESDRKRWRYAWEVGQSTVLRNAVSAPGDSGEEIDFRFRERNNPAVTSSLEIEYRMGDRHEISTRLAPFEVREEEQFGVEVDFAGTLFERIEVIDTQYIGYVWRSRWRYRLLESRAFSIKAGAGIDVLGTRAELTVQDDSAGSPGKNARADHLRVTPVLHLSLSVTPCRRSALFVEADSWPTSSERYLDWVAGFRWRLAARWDVAVVHRRLEWTFASSDFNNDFDLEFNGLTVGYS